MLIFILILIHTFFFFFFYFLTPPLRFFFFFFNDPAPPEIYPLSLPDALPICSRREARILARLRHPRIVTIHDFGIAEGAGAYLVMELLEGRPLQQELKSRGRPSSSSMTR